MLMNRWTMAAGMLGGLVCAGFLVLALLPARPAVTLTNFDRIEVGMTQVEAEAMLGGPPKTSLPTEGTGRCFARADWPSVTPVGCGVEMTEPP
jgi:hypothetical protein